MNYLLSILVAGLCVLGYFQNKKIDAKTAELETLQATYDKSDDALAKAERERDVAQHQFKDSEEKVAALTAAEAEASTARGEAQTLKTQLAAAQGEVQALRKQQSLPALGTAMERKR